MKKYASATLPLCTFVSFIVLIFFALHKSAVPSQVLYDPLYNKQWHLQNNAKNVVISSAPADDRDFTMADIAFHSSVRLGVKDFWESYPKHNDKELTIAILGSCVDIHHEDLETHMDFGKYKCEANDSAYLWRR